MFSLDNVNPGSYITSKYEQRFTFIKTKNRSNDKPSGGKKMKKTAAVIAGIFLVAMVAGNALAETGDSGFAGISKTEMDTVRQMVAGNYRPEAEVSVGAKAPVVNIGAIELSQAEYENQKDMFAGRYVPAPDRPRSVVMEMVNLGRVELSRNEYESVKAQVRINLDRNSAPLLSSAPVAFEN
jgi:hypothetical protein